MKITEAFVRQFKFPFPLARLSSTHVQFLPWSRSGETRNGTINWLYETPVEQGNKRTNERVNELKREKCIREALTD